MKYLYLAICLFFPLLAHAEEYRDINVQHLSVEQGLSHYTVNSIYQDEFGFIWIGTMDGLNRYDGSRIEVFKPRPADSLSIRENNIRMICGDGQGHLFIKGLGSLSEYDMRANSFRMLREKGARCVTYNDGQLWVAEGGVLRTYDRERGKFLARFQFGKAGLDGVNVSCFIVGRNGDPCICTARHGFYRVNRSGHIVQHFMVGEANSLFEDSHGAIWIATRTEGLYRIGRNGDMTRWRHDGSDAHSLGHDNVRQICEDRMGNYWVSTFDGLSRLDSAKGTFTHYRYEFKHTAFNLRSIISMMCDRQGTLWIGSFYEGLCSYNTVYDTYRYYRPADRTPGLLNSPIVGAVAEDRDGVLWFGTEGGGLNRLDGSRNRFRTFDRSAGLSSEVIKSLLCDTTRQVLWIASLYHGVDRMDLRTGAVRRLGSRIEGETDARVENVVHMTSYGDSLLLATNTGIVVLDKRTERMTRLPAGFNAGHRAQVWDMELDEFHNLWFSTSTDLYCYNLRSGISKYYAFRDIAANSVNNNMNAILRDSRGRMWFGSSGSGFFLYDPRHDTFRNYGRAEGLENGYVTGLCEDSRSGLLYIATNDGIASFDPETGKIACYDHRTGFPLTAVNENSLYVTSDGELFACGLDGMVLVRCGDLRIQPRDYDVYVSGLFIDNRPVHPDPQSRSAVLHEEILFQRSIRLGPGHSVVGFELANNDYLNAAGMQMEYKLEGFDEDFVQAGNNDYVTYTNLNPGRYTFVVRGVSENTDGSFPTCRIAVRVVPPFYKTGWFILLVALILCGIGLYLILAYTTGIRLRSLLESEKREKTYINQVNQSKLRFFTNISHEFRTPLTLISGLLELLLQRSDLRPTVYSQILNVYKNSQRMRRLVDEVIDIRKQEQGYMKLRVCRCSLSDFLREIFLSFEEYSCHNGIDFSFTVPDRPLEFCFDPAQLEKVIYNLLSNAFKYTRPGDRIVLSAGEEGDGIIIRVADSGIGIAPEHLPHVFERFYQDDQLNASVPNQGSGVGLSLAKAIVEMHGGTIGVASTPGEWTVFTIAFPREPHFPGEYTVVDSREAACPQNYIRDYKDGEIAVPAAEAPDETKPVKMLIVEDSEEVRDMLSQIFSPIYGITMAENGDEGIRQAREVNPDIILSDIMMPGMSGVEMCSKLKNNLETCHIPIVLLTARTAEEYAVEGLQTGADDYITKPFNVKLLVARCNNLVAGRRRLQQKYLRQPDASVQMLSANPNDQKILQKAVDLVLEHLDDVDFNIGFFAREMGLSRTYLFTKIKGLTGQSPNEFVSTIRLKQAVAKLAGNPDASMVDIAYSLGFSSPSYFIKCFKDMYGKTPNMYRREMAGK